MPPASVLLLAPMGSEVRPLVRLTSARAGTAGDLRVHRGLAGSTAVTIVQIGIGPARARQLTGRALEVVRADHVVVCGVAGGLDPALRVGSVIVPEVVMDAATGRRFVASPLHGVQPKGVIATSDVLVTEDSQVAALRALGAAAVEMESSGVAEACEEAGLPWTTFRSISDRPDDDLVDDSVMSLLRPDGSADLLAALRLAVRSPRRVPAMVKLGHHASRAASLAARAAIAPLGPSAGRRPMC